MFFIAEQGNMIQIAILAVLGFGQLASTTSAPDIKILGYDTSGEYSHRLPASHAISNVDDLGDCLSTASSYKSRDKDTASNKTIVKTLSLVLKFIINCRQFIVGKHRYIQHRNHYHHQKDNPSRAHTL